MTLEVSALSLPSIQFMLTSTLDGLDVNPKANEEDRQIQHQAAIEALTALKPRDAHEANLAARAVAAHHAAMACFRRAAQPNLPDNLAMRILGRALAFSQLAERMQAALSRGKATIRSRSQRTHVAEPPPPPAEPPAVATTAEAQPKSPPPAEAPAAATTGEAQPKSPPPAEAPAAATKTEAQPKSPPVPVAAAAPSTPASRPQAAIPGSHASKPTTTQGHPPSSAARPAPERATA